MTPGSKDGQAEAMRPKIGPRGITYDRGQFALNGESYCYQVLDGCYCGRAKDWPGHPADHDFVDSLTHVLELSAEIKRLLREVSP